MRMIILTIIIIDFTIHHHFTADLPNMNESTATQKIENAPLSPSRSKPMIKSKELLGQEGWVLIEHNDQHYLLRQTQSGKLILTK